MLCGCVCGVLCVCMCGVVVVRACDVCVKRDMQVYRGGEHTHNLSLFRSTGETVQLMRDNMFPHRLDATILTRLVASSACGCAFAVPPPPFFLPP